MAVQLQLGTTKLNITPQEPVPLAGFSDRSQLGAFSGVSQPLHARIFIFRTGEKPANEQSILLVSADLIWWGSDRVPALKNKIYDTYGIPPSNIVLHATHTHSGPQTSGLFTSYLGVMSEAYMQMLEQTLVEGIQAALDNIEDVSIERGIGLCDFSINRRLRVNNHVELHPNPAGLTDPELIVFRFHKSGGETKALLIHYTCHPVITKENFISSEFTGVAMDALEQSIAGGAVAGYLQGFCGDINPAKDGSFGRGTGETVIERGNALAKQVRSVLDKPMTPLRGCKLETKLKQVVLPLQKPPTIEELLELKENQGVIGEWSSLLLASGNIRSEIPLEMSFIAIADGLSFLALNCEIVVEYGLWVKQHFSGKVLPVAYSNGMFGYVPTEKQLEEGGYEPKGSVPYFGLPAPFSPEVEEKVLEAVLQLVPESITQGEE